MTAATLYVRLDDSAVLDRFMSKVSKQADGCWLWTGFIHPKGYGRFYPTSLGVQAHRWAYLSFVGPVPDELQLDHLCRVRACVNPSHLEPVDNRENQRRGQHPTTGIAFRTNTCPKGHSLADAYLSTRKSDGLVSRRCRPCQRDRHAAYRARKAARS